tara:strand:+ start:753 stop:899 length:147 start_codon:yes stop_codon:yes gene_type:complete
MRYFTTTKVLKNGEELNYTLEEVQKFCERAGYRKPHIKILKFNQYWWI